MVKALILSALIGGMSPYLPFWRFDRASQSVAVAIVISILSFVVIYPDEAKKIGGKRKMINTKAGELTLKGSKAELIDDLAVIVRGIKVTIMEDDKETEESVKQDIDKAVKVGLMNEEEFRTFQKEKIKEAASAFVDGLLGGIFNEDK
nr:MAG TPA: VIT1 protein [Caudoviricetes sp.]